MTIYYYFNHHIFLFDSLCIVLNLLSKAKTRNNCYNIFDILIRAKYYISDICTYILIYYINQLTNWSS